MQTGSRSIIANCSSFTANTIVKRAGGYNAQTYWDVGHSFHKSQGRGGRPETAWSISDGELREKHSSTGDVEHSGDEQFDADARGRTDHANQKISVIFHPTISPRRKTAILKKLDKRWPDHSIHDFSGEYEDFAANFIGAIPPGTPPQQGYDQWRNEIGSGQNQYPTGDQASPTEPQPLDEWEGDIAPQMALPSGWEDKRGGKGQQRPGKCPASRYQQPFGDQDVGQGRGDREEKNFGPLEF